jgi:hypothetical protein
MCSCVLPCATHFTPQEEAQALQLEYVGRLRTLAYLRSRVQGRNGIEQEEARLAARCR